MGYISNVAISIIGNKGTFFDLQNQYFKQLEKENFDEHFSWRTVCSDLEDYIFYGKSLWHHLRVEALDTDLLKANMLESGIKWGYFNLQWETLSNLLSEFQYSWQFIRVGLQIDDVEVDDNSETINNFDDSVTQRYSLKQYLIDNERNIKHIHHT